MRLPLKWKESVALKDGYPPMSVYCEGAKMKNLCYSCGGAVRDDLFYSS